ncbi:hypothetical protein [Sulfitobacter delicatus]|uniref:Uncharacterized protein n=1 Tax=Sulfitobacter delicatus TaxID=218672 RepID=A0A1G7PHV7_9RHOB|nr:hypothetical protein [Sulfitobacter delicatus]SDF85817.1 hypothetical protein SAMN04489759_103338 [Sulfitobacter delicatus]
MPRTPIFLEKRSYRQRRMMDAVRLLPFLGLMLWMVPLLWPVPVAGVVAEAAPAMPMSVALRYLFGVWLLLIFASWALWRRTRDIVSGEARDPAEEAR